MLRKKSIKNYFTWLEPDLNIHFMKFPVQILWNNNNKFNLLKNYAPLFHYFLFILFDSTHLLPALHYVTSYILRSKNKTNRWRKGDWKIKNTFYSKSNTRKTCASLINNSIKKKISSIIITSYLYTVADLTLISCMS